MLARRAGDSTAFDISRHSRSLPVPIPARAISSTSESSGDCSQACRFLWLLLGHPRPEQPFWEALFLPSARYPNVTGCAFSSAAFLPVPPECSRLCCLFCSTGPSLHLPPILRHGWSRWRPSSPQVRWLLSPASPRLFWVAQLANLAVYKVTQSPARVVPPGTSGRACPQLARGCVSMCAVATNSAAQQTTSHSMRRKLPTMVSLVLGCCLSTGVCCWATLG